MASLKFNICNVCFSFAEAFDEMESNKSRGDSSSSSLIRPALKRNKHASLEQDQNTHKLKGFLQVKHSPHMTGKSRNRLMRKVRESLY